MEWNYIIVLFIIFNGKEKSLFHVFQAGDIDQAIDMKNPLENPERDNEDIYNLCNAHAEKEIARTIHKKF